MPKTKIERPEAILRKKRNTQKGLQVRNRILKLLYENPTKSFTTSEIIEGVGINYSSITYHLKNMLVENVVNNRKRARRNIWQITGLGQQTIKRWLENDE
ncbi:MAG: winged helix-turn-helix transcriptional regulator [Candidatus Heimdallarchaeota archaeon]